MEDIEKQAIEACQNGDLEQFSGIYDKYLGKYTILSIFARITKKLPKTLLAMSF